jgi:type II secretory pathway predicted ATPase ExeA
MSATQLPPDVDPFGPALLPGALHVGSTLQQRIDLIEHLLEFGRQLIVLSGPAGSGKSTLLQAIETAAGQRWSCVPLQGGPALTGRALLSQVADALDVDLSADSEPRMAHTMLRLRLNVLERAGKLVVVLVDDADQLPADAVTALLALARTEDQTGEARVLMTADHEHAGLLANLQRDRPQHGLVHVVEIPPLSATQVGEFLAQRLTAAGLQLGDYFNASDIQSLAGAADGNPARIVALARQHFAGKRAARPGRQRRATTSRAGLPGAGFKLPKLADRRLLPLFLVPPALAALAWWALRDEPAEAPMDTAAVDVELPAAAELPREEPRPEPPATPAEPAESTESADRAAPAAEPDQRFADNGDNDLIEIVLPDEPVMPDSQAAGTPVAIPARVGRAGDSAAGRGSAAVSAAAGSHADSVGQARADPRTRRRAAAAEAHASTGAGSTADTETGPQARPAAGGADTTKARAATGGPRHRFFFGLAAQTAARSVHTPAGGRTRSRRRWPLHPAPWSECRSDDSHHPSRRSGMVCAGAWLLSDAAGCPGGGRQVACRGQERGQAVGQDDRRTRQPAAVTTL